MSYAKWLQGPCGEDVAKIDGPPDPGVKLVPDAFAGYGWL